MFGGPLRSYDLVFNSKFIYKFLPSICVVRQIEKESVWRARVVTYIARVYYSFLNDVVGAVVLVLFVCVLAYNLNFSPFLRCVYFSNI